MLLVRLIVACVMLSTWWPASARSQEPPPAADDSPQVLSGTVEEADGGRVVVNRAVLGKPAELRTFLITGET